MHNGPVVGSILAGSATYQIEGQPTGADGVTFLAYFLLSPGQQAQLTMLPP